MDDNNGEVSQDMQVMWQKSQLQWDILLRAGGNIQIEGSPNVFYVAIFWYVFTVN